MSVRNPRKYAEYIKSIYSIGTLYTEQRITLTIVWCTHELTKAEFVDCMRKWREQWTIKNPQWKIGDCTLTFNKAACYGKTVFTLIDTGTKSNARK